MKKILLPLATATSAVLTISAFASNPAPTQEALAKQISVLQAQTAALQKEIRQIRMNKHHNKHKPTNKILTDKKLINHFVTITTSPFLGNRTAFAPFDLLYETSSNNEDLRLLEQKQALLSKLHSNNSYITRPMVEISGGIEGQLYSTEGFGTKPTDGISLSTAELDINALSGSWASAFMSIDYSGSPISNGNRQPNSKIYLKRGVATFGNLNKSPFYGSIGLMYVPFGRYASAMLSTPVTLSMGRIRTEAVLLGFKLQNGLYGSAYGYAGSQTSGGSPLFKQYGANLAFKRSLLNGNGGLSFGAGWVSNIADSQGMQDTGRGTGGGVFGGFAVLGPAQASTASNNGLAHRVDGFDVNTKVNYTNTTLMAEYLGAAEKFNSADMTFNGKGAEPRALHIELNYALPFCKKCGTNVGVAYGRTWEALPLNLPKESYTVYLSSSLMKDTVETIEYRHDKDYSASDTYSGRGATNTTPTGTGKDRNSVIAQIGAYF